MKTQRNNTLLFAFTLLGILPQAFAQPTASPAESGPKNLRIGFKASPNFTWTRMIDGNVKNNGMGLGFSYGLMMDFNLGNNPNYWIGTEVLVTSLPVKVAARDTMFNNNVSPGAFFTNTEWDYRTQYVQIPVTVKMKTNEIGRLTYWFQFGLAPSVLIQRKVTTTAAQQFYQQGTSSHDPNLDKNDPLDFDGFNGRGAFRDNASFLRLPMILGAGVEGKISGKTSWVAGLRFDNAFTDFFLDKSVNGRVNYLGIQLGIFF